jgi:organic hydroperoxide reductase OsmC/OhrA
MISSTVIAISLPPIRGCTGGALRRACHGRRAATRPPHPAARAAVAADFGAAAGAALPFSEALLAPRALSGVTAATSHGGNRRPTMTTPFPHHYEVRLDGDGPRAARLWSTAHPPIATGFPPQFGGTERVWSPEELLLSAVGACLYTTFSAIAEKEKLEARSYLAHVEGTLDKSAAGIVFTAITARVELRVPAADVERARALLERASRFCIISNSLKPPVAVAATVTGE